MSDTQVTEALVLKLRKLMTLRDHASATEGEASAAAGMVQDLMAKYNLSLHQIESAGTKDDGGRARRQHDRAAMYSFQRELMACIAKNNFCRHWIEEVQVPHEKKAGFTRKAKRHFLLGREINVKSVEMVYDYLVETMDRVLPYQGMEKRGKDALLWLAGCSDRLIVRLDAQREQAEEASKVQAAEEDVRSRHPGAASSSNALVLVDVYQNEEELNEDYMKGLEPGTTTRRRLEAEAKARARHAKIDELVATGVSWEDAYYIASYGHIPDWVLKSRVEDELRANKRAADASNQKSKPETDAQRRKREERAQRAESADNDRYYRSQRKYAERNCSDAYQQGARAGADIGLDRQVAEELKKRIG